MQLHDVDRLQSGEDSHEHRRDDREVLRDVVGDRERGQRSAGDQQLLADAHDVDQLGRVGVEVDHVAGLLRGRRSGVHRDPDIRLREGRGVVGAVTGHGDEVAALLLATDELQLVLRRRFGQVVVDTGLGGDRLGRERVVAGDHHRADAHPAHVGEPGRETLLHDVLQVDDAQDGGLTGGGLGRHREGRASDLGDPFDLIVQFAQDGRRDRPGLFGPGDHRGCSALADLTSRR